MLEEQKRLDLIKNLATFKQHLVCKTDLSDNVKRSLEEARKEGIRACLAPLGYLNVVDKQGNKDVVPDSDQRHLIVKMFELYATGI